MLVSGRSLSYNVIVFLLHGPNLSPPLSFFFLLTPLLDDEVLKFPFTFLGKSKKSFVICGGGRKFVGNIVFPSGSCESFDVAFPPP